jgi:hypothetical protein
MMSFALEDQRAALVAVGNSYFVPTLTPFFYSALSAKVRQ